MLHPSGEKGPGVKSPVRVSHHLMPLESPEGDTQSGGSMEPGRTEGEEGSALGGERKGEDSTADLMHSYPSPSVVSNSGLFTKPSP